MFQNMTISYTLALVCGCLILDSGNALAATSKSGSKVTLTISVPEASAGADANLKTLYAGMPWLPCTAKNEAFATSKLNKKTPEPTTKPNDVLKFDIAVSNEDKVANDDPNSTVSDGIMDNHLYVFLVNPNAKDDPKAFGEKLQINTSATIPFASIWAVTGSPFQNTSLTLKPFAGIRVIDDKTDPATYEAAKSFGVIDPKEAIYKTAASFVGSTFTTTLMSGSMAFDKTTTSQGLTQGPWMIVAFLVNASRVTDMTTEEFQDPKNWEAWDAKPFILGTPFYAPNKGTGLAGGNGLCK